MKKRFTITLDPTIAKQAKIQAVKADTKLSTLIEKLLVTWLEAKKEKRND